MQINLVIFKQRYERDGLTGHPILRRDAGACDRFDLCCLDQLSAPHVDRAENPQTSSLTSCARKFVGRVIWIRNSHYVFSRGAVSAGFRNLAR